MPRHVSGVVVKSFQAIEHQVLARFSFDKQSLQQALPTALDHAALCALEDAYCLSTLSRRVFRAGLKHALVDAKWPAFEKAFWQFSPPKLLLLSDEQLEQLMSNTDIIRHWGKIKAVRHNAAFLQRMADQYGSVGRWLADWPGSDIIGLWKLLKKEGAQLGGMSGASFLRMVGKDTFLLTDDVVTALKNVGTVDRRPTAQRDLRSVQQQFNYWQEETGYKLCELSRILSFTVSS